MRNYSVELCHQAVMLLLEGKSVFEVESELNMYPSDVRNLQHFVRGKELQLTGSVFIPHKTMPDGSMSFRKTNKPRKAWLNAMDRYRGYPFDV